MSSWQIIVAVIIVAFLIGVFIPPRAAVQATASPVSVGEPVAATTEGW